MARVTTEEVKVLIPVPASVTDLSPFINVASELIDMVIVEEYPDAYSDEYLKELERWLSAHFTAIRYTRTSTEKISSVSESFQYKLGLNFNCTMYGQTVLSMDTTGAFATLQQQAEDGKKSAAIGWLGTLDSNGYPR